jgi:dGTPase
MNWKTLYTSKRLGAESRYETEKADLIRNAYLLDYEQLIFYSPFRRMQNKTQVFPVPGPIFVHNRLTHSHKPPFTTMHRGIYATRKTDFIGSTEQVAD